MILSERVGNLLADAVYQVSWTAITESYGRNLWAGPKGCSRLGYSSRRIKTPAAIKTSYIQHISSVQVRPSFSL